MIIDLLETADVARALGLSSERVRQLANARRLLVVAVTPRGRRLFRVEDVEAFRRQREERVEQY